MTLPEFFQQLIDLTKKADITEKFGGHMQYDRKAWVIDRLHHLRTSAQGDPKYWPFQSSQNQSLWDSAAPYLMNAGILSRYIQNAPLMQQMLAFLCRRNVV